MTTHARGRDACRRTTDGPEGSASTGCVSGDEEAQDPETRSLRIKLFSLSSEPRPANEVMHAFARSFASVHKHAHALRHANHTNMHRGMSRCTYGWCLRGGQITLADDDIFQTA